MLATEAARNPLSRPPAMATFQTRGHMNGSNSSFASTSTTSHSNRFTSSSNTSNFSNAEQSGLFPPPMPGTFSPPPSEAPQPTGNIMNRRAGAESSLYQICVNLKRRLAEVPGFEEHIVEMEEEEAEDGDFIDPVTAMWNCLRRGLPLMTLYNALRPVTPIEIDTSRYGEAKLGKAATFKFLQACINDLKFPGNEVFLITDLYGEDTTGFVKVTKCVNRVLDQLQRRGLLVQRAETARDPNSAEPRAQTIRQKIVEEFVTTERDYVQHLQTLQQFKNEVESSGAIAGDAAHDIFLNLNALLDFQRRFLIRIEQQNCLPESQQDWGKLLHHYKDSFRVYEPFIANQNRCRAALEKNWDKLTRAPLSPDLHDLVESQSALLGFLLKPFQRLTRYPLLLTQLREKGGLDEQRRKNINEGIAAAESILQRANEAVRKEQRMEAVNDLQSRVEDWKGHRIEHFGDLLLYGNYSVQKGEGSKDAEREYKVYLFERILLCCKEINPNKPKNKMLPNSKPLVDKRGQPKLQLKGRIFMQNVTDVLTIAKAEKSTYTIQIYWKGDPGVENFMIRFPDDSTMREWQERVQKQQRKLTDVSKKANDERSITPHWNDLQPKPENPFAVDEDDEDMRPQAAMPGRSDFSSSRQTSNTSLRSSSGHPTLGRLPPRHHQEPVLAHPGVPLSLNTSVPPTAPSPGEFGGGSYFSPTNESPISSRSTSQAGMYPVSRQQGPPPGWAPYENAKHRTAPAMPRAPSRDGPKPSIPVLPSANAQTIRVRSASTPDINGPGGRRPSTGPYPQEPVPPIPNNIRMPINRSQSNSPFEQQMPMHSGPPSHMYPPENYRLPPKSAPSDPKAIPPQYLSTPSPSTPTNDRNSLYPSQLKVKIMFEPHPSHVTIVVPTTIKHRTLVDRVDSKMSRVNTGSIAQGTARLRYRDVDDDLVDIGNDDDVGLAIEEWGTIHEDRLRQGIVDDFELFWDEKMQRQ